MTAPAEAAGSRAYALTPHVPPRDPAELAAEVRSRYEDAAREIIATWIRSADPGTLRIEGRDCYPDAVAGKPPTVATWLAAFAVDSCALHDTCDANMVFDDVLRRLGIIGDDFDAGNEAHVKPWNAVTFDYGFLERAAAAALQEVETP